MVNQKRMNTVEHLLVYKKSIKQSYKNIVNQLYLICVNILTLATKRFIIYPNLFFFFPLKVLFQLLKILNVWASSSEISSEFSGISSSCLLSYLFFEKYLSWVHRV